jgi:hypothetical protein
MLKRSSDGRIKGEVPILWLGLLAILGWMAWGWVGVFVGAVTFLAASLVLTAIAMYAGIKTNGGERESNT